MAMPHDGYAKLLEEMSELGTVAAKRIAVNGDSYYDGRDLHEESGEEIADVLAAIKFILAKNFYPHEIRILKARERAKYLQFLEWDKEGDYEQPVGNPEDA